MGSLNKVQIIGNLGQDPETKFLPSGDAVTNLSVATTDRWKDKEGVQQERTEWHRVAFFGPKAETIAKYLSKGDPIYVEGSLQTRKWQDKDGNDRYTTEIKGRDFQFLSPKGEGGTAGCRPVSEAQFTKGPYGDCVIRQAPPDAPRPERPTTADAAPAATTHRSTSAS